MPAPEAAILLRALPAAQQLAAIEPWLQSLGRASATTSPLSGDEEWGLLLDDYSRLDIQETGEHWTQGVTIDLVAVPERGAESLHTPVVVPARPAPTWVSDPWPSLQEKLDRWARLQAERAPFDQRNHAKWERDQRQALGFAVRWRVEVVADYNGPHARQVVWRLCIWLARALGGWIDVQSELSPPDLHPPLARFPARLPAPERRRAVRRYLQRFPGRVLQLEFWVWPDDIYVRHFVDADFLEAWVQQPWLR